MFDDSTGVLEFFLVFSPGGLGSAQGRGPKRPENPSASVPPVHGVPIALVFQGPAKPGASLILILAHGNSALGPCFSSAGRSRFGSWRFLPAFSDQKRVPTRRVTHKKGFCFPVADRKRVSHKKGFRLLKGVVFYFPPV